MTGPNTASGGARLEARSWGWRHAGRSAWALDGLDLVIEPGERVLIAGASGAGKSTLLRGFAGVLGGDDEGEQRGELRVDGVRPDHSRGRVGLVLQDPDTQIVLGRVGDDVAFGCENLGLAPDRIWPRVRSSLDAVGLDLPLTHPTAQLSGGQKQRLALASMLALRPRAVLLDEPTANLDPPGARMVRDSVARVLDATGSTLLIVEHRVDLWIDVVDRVIVLDENGRYVEDGRPGAVFSSPSQALLDAGVWLPGRPPSVPGRSARVGVNGSNGLSVPMDAATTLLRASSLSVGRGEWAREGIDLEIDSGSVTAIVGDNGAGKTTLALTIAGLLPPRSGILSATPALARGAVGDRPIRWKSRQLLTRIGMVFQEPEHQFLTATVRAEVEVGLTAMGVRGRERLQRSAALLDALGLAALANCNPFTLSGGQKRRLSVATVLATAPQVIVLDEPTFGQDRNGWQALASLVVDAVERGSAIVAVSHDEHFVRSVADSVFRLDATDTRPAGRAVGVGGGAA